MEREGDWVCFKCKNLNFSFRKICNRCKLDKNENIIFYEKHMKYLTNVIEKNEMLQNKVKLNVNMNSKIDAGVINNGNFLKGNYASCFTSESSNLNVNY